MDIKLDQELERWADDELRRLSNARAPRTLVPRVLAVIESSGREEWWRRPWLFWPPVAQVFSTVVLVVSAAVLWYGIGSVWNAVQGAGYLAHASRWLGLATLMADSLVALGRAMVLAGQSAGQQFLLYGLVVCLVMYGVCVGFGTLCYRMISTRGNDS